MEEKDPLWNKVLSDMALAVSKANFAMWFKDTFIAKVEDGVVSVGVPSAFVKEWFMSKYHKMIFKSLREASEHVRSIEYIIAKSDAKIERIVLLTDGFKVAGFAALRELGVALRDFRHSGKQVVAYGSMMDQKQYYLAAQADELYLDPDGGVLLEGLGR